MLDYFYPELENSNKENQKKKFVNELLSPEQIYFESMSKANNMKKPKNDIIGRNEGKTLTNDGREMLNENK